MFFVAEHHEPARCFSLAERREPARSMFSLAEQSEPPGDSRWNRRARARAAKCFPLGDSHEHSFHDGVLVGVLVPVQNPSQTNDSRTAATTLAW